MTDIYNEKGKMSNSLLWLKVMEQTVEIVIEMEIEIEITPFL